MSSTVKVTDSSFETEVLHAEVPVIVDFWAEWCGPCRMIAPALDELAKEYSGKIKIAKVNVDENQRYAGELGVRSIPMLFMFKGGKVVSQMLGAKPKSSLDAWIREAI